MVKKKGDHRCHRCKINFSQLGSLRLHRKRQRKCSTCDHVACTLWKLKKHELVHQTYASLRRFKCTYENCQYAAKLKFQRDRHMTTHYQGQRYPCSHCDKTFSHEYSVAKHEKLHFRVKQAVRVPDVKQCEEKPSYKCTECEFVTYRLPLLNRHTKQSHSERSAFACDQCNERFTVRKLLLKHVRIYHKGQAVGVQCHLCDYNAMLKMELDDHMLKTHRDAKPYKCDECDFECGYKGVYHKHMREVHRRQRFRCEHCPFRTDVNTHLKKHLVEAHAVDHGKVFHCTICEFRTNGNVALYTHMKTHRDFKPFSCSKCSYETVTAAILKKHMRFHCDDCNFLAGNARSLGIHKADSHGGQTFKCDQCEFITTKPYLFSKHRNQIHRLPTKFHKCLLCSYSSHVECDIHTHMEDTHHVKPPSPCHCCSFSSSATITLEEHLSMAHKSSLASFHAKRVLEQPLSAVQSVDKSTDKCLNTGSLQPRNSSSLHSVTCYDGNFSGDEQDRSSVASLESDKTFDVAKMTSNDVLTVVSSGGKRGKAMQAKGLSEASYDCTVAANEKDLICPSKRSSSRLSTIFVEKKKVVTIVDSNMDEECQATQKDNNQRHSTLINTPTICSDKHLQSTALTNSHNEVGLKLKEANSCVAAQNTAKNRLIHISEYAVKECRVVLTRITSTNISEMVEELDMEQSRGSLSACREYNSCNVEDVAYSNDKSLSEQVANAQEINPLGSTSGQQTQNHKNDQRRRIAPPEFPAKHLTSRIEDCFTISYENAGSDIEAVRDSHTGQNSRPPLNNIKVTKSPRYVRQPSTLSCNKCDFKAENGYRLRCHKIEQHRRQYKCFACKFETSGFKAFRAHLANYKKAGTVLKCRICSYSTPVYKHLAHHNRSQHFSARDKQCPQCEYVTHSNGALERHMKTHSGEKKFRCTICEYAAHQKINLITHMRSHTGERPFKCHICSHAFARQGHLKSHIRTHTGERNYPCTMCSYRAAEPKTLALHLRTHYQLPECYSCPTCSKMFKTTDALRVHNRLVHLAKKSHQCPECPFKTTTANYLRWHQKIHTGERPFPCSQCSHRSKTRTALKEHQYTHTDKRPFNCTVCDYKAIKKSRLVEHIAKKNHQPVDST